MENNLDNDSSKPKIQTNLILIAIGLILITIAIMLYPHARQSLANQRAMANWLLTLTPEGPSTTPSPSPLTLEEVDPPILPDPEIYAHPNQFGTLILSIQEGLDAHLFAYQPFLEDWSGYGFSGLPLTRLTSGPYQDITPEISKDGRRIAFSSNRNGPWDIYILDLLTGEIEQFTDTEAYDANPSWSNDDLWLVYETYQINNLEIIIQKVDKTQGPIHLTNHPAADHTPDWSPQGRWISFISDRSGQSEVWYADLDSPEEDKAVKIKNLPGKQVQSPAWSGDGRYLSWGLVTDDGNHILVNWDSQNPEEDPVHIGTGDKPQWGLDSDLLYAVMELPDQTFLTAYPDMQADPQILMPAIKLPGRVEGISWTQGNFDPIVSALDPGPKPTPLWEPIAEEGSSPENTPKRTIELRNLSAPISAFSEDAFGNFTSLRAAVIDAAGWDYLSTLENAFVPLNQSLTPGIHLEWLYTGRGMMVNDVPRLANWVVLVREDYGYQTYWRIYIKAYNQDGYQGRPLHTRVWDLNARYTGNNDAYEQGGSLSESIPMGYWVDFTALAKAFGWTRFPTRLFWQLSEKASRYQYFAFTQGLDLESALLELYSPAEIGNLTDFFTP
jgi:TolB protein